MQSPVVFKGLWGRISFIIKASAFFDCPFYGSKKYIFVHGIFTENSNLLNETICFKMAIGQDLSIHTTLLIEAQDFYRLKHWKTKLYVLHPILGFSFCLR